MKIFIYGTKSHIDDLNLTYKDKVEYVDTDFGCYYIKLDSNTFTLDLNKYREEMHDMLVYTVIIKPDKGRYKYIKEQISKYKRKYRYINIITPNQFPDTIYMEFDINHIIDYPKRIPILSIGV